jgi:hypothetical protein
MWYLKTNVEYIDFWKNIFFKFFGYGVFKIQLNRIELKWNCLYLEENKYKSWLIDMKLIDF